MPIVTTLRIHIRPKSEWESEDPVILTGEAALDKGTTNLKVGMDNKRWSELEYGILLDSTAPHSASHAQGGRDPITPESIGAATVEHTHTLDDLGAADRTHTHTPEDLGAADKDHTHLPEEIGAADRTHTHTPEDLGAAEVNHSHNTADVTDLLAAPHQWLRGQRYPVAELTAADGAVLWNMAEAPVAAITLTDVVTTITMTNAQPGATYELTVRQDGTGGKSVAWPASVLWPGGVALAVTSEAGAEDLVMFSVRGTASTPVIRGVAAQNLRSVQQ